MNIRTDEQNIGCVDVSAKLTHSLYSYDSYDSYCYNTILWIE